MPKNSAFAEIASSPPIGVGPVLAPLPKPAGKTPRRRREEGAMTFLRGICCAVLPAGAQAAATGAADAQTQGTIKIGVLHSLSGTMAISETTLKDTILMMVDDVNKHGGLLGKKLEAVVVDPASNWPLF